MDSETRAVLGNASADWAGDVTRYKRSGPGKEEVSENAPLRGQGDAALRMVRELVREPIAAVGHRIVHGGKFHTAIRVVPAVRAKIAALADLAPLHNPPGLEGLD